MSEPFFMMYADYEEWYRITFSKVPLLASHQHLQIPNKSLLPTSSAPRHDFADSVCLEEQFTWIVSFIFPSYDKERKIWAPFVTCRKMRWQGDQLFLGDKGDWPWHFTWCQNGSGLFSYLHNERQVERGESKTCIWIPGDAWNTLYL